MHRVAQCVSRYIREQDLLRPGQRVGVAVSGGADSIALLRVLLELRQELGLVLSLVHVNHRIRGAEADADQQFVAALAEERGLALHAHLADTPAHAAARRLSLEAAGRELRYEYFQRLLTEDALDKVATAHTLDDQAETVLLRLTRGTGTTGLAGIYPQWPVVSGPSSKALAGTRGTAAIVRPLLAVRRHELESYLRELGQAWREDASNLDPHYARNRVRHRVLPLLETELNPRVRELLAETAAIARAEEDYWQAEVSRIVAQVWSGAGEHGSLDLAGIRRLPLALQRRLLRAAAKSRGVRLEFRHVEELLALAQAPPSRERQLLLPGGWQASRRRDRLHFSPPKAVRPAARDFAYALSLPGEVAVAETGTIFRATLGPLSPEQALQAYDPAAIPPSLEVRNWRPGDRFWPSHTRAPRKIKELLQERKIPLSQRRNWPVIAGQEQIIWLRGFPAPQALLASPGRGPALVIQEYALQEALGKAE
jgi:tRNA(Ile)-lysidine synthase